MKKQKLPPFYFKIFLILEILLGILLRQFILGKIFILFGGLFILFGITLNLWTDSIFKKEKTTVKPGEKSHKLIDYGPFRITRHPMYLGMFLILLGIILCFRNLYLIILPILFAAIIDRRYILLEEKMMKKTFGKKYSEYMKKVRRWI